MKIIRPKQIKQYFNRFFLPLLFVSLSLTSCSNDDAKLFDKKPVQSDYSLSNPPEGVNYENAFTMLSKEKGHSAEPYSARIVDLDSDGSIDAIFGGYHSILAIKPTYRDSYSSWNYNNPGLTADLDSATQVLAQKVYDLSQKLSYRIDSSRYAKWKETNK